MDIEKFIKPEGMKCPEFPLPGQHTKGPEERLASNGQAYVSYGYGGDTEGQVVEAYAEWLKGVGNRAVEWRSFPRTEAYEGRYFIYWRCLVKE